MARLLGVSSLLSSVLSFSSCAVDMAPHNGSESPSMGDLQTSGHGDGDGDGDGDHDDDTATGTSGGDSSGGDWSGCDLPWGFSCVPDDVCTEWGCGDISDPFDADGCPRARCATDLGPMDCPDGQACYVPAVDGGCEPTTFGCELDTESDGCSCGSTGDCDGGYCVPIEQLACRQLDHKACDARKDCRNVGGSRVIEPSSDTACVSNYFEQIGCIKATDVACDINYYCDADDGRMWETSEVCDAPGGLESCAPEPFPLPKCD